MRSNIFERLSFLSLFLVIILLPIFFLPFTNIPVEISKGLLLVIGLAFSIIFWAIARFLDGKIVFPKSVLLLSGFGVVLAFLLSALVSGSSSGNSQVSLFGTMFDIGSFYFIFSAFVLMLMSSIIFRTAKQARIVLFGTILSSVLVLIFQSVHLFFPTTTSLGILAGKTGNIIGSWNALGLFTGFFGLLCLLIIEFFPISKVEKFLLEIFILLSVLLATVINLPLVWILLGVFSLIIFVYKASITTLQKSEREDEEKKHFPLISFVVLIISLLLFLSAGSFSDIIPNRLQVSSIEISPPVGATMSVTKGVLAKNPLFGIGPNRFGEAWAMYKPVSINIDNISGVQFWGVSFDSSFGLLPTLTATVGGLGIFALLAFFVLFLIIGAKSVFSSIKNRVNFEMMAFFVLSLYLFVSSFFYPTGSVMFLLSFAFTGIFIGLIASSSNGEIALSFLNDHRKSFFSILVLILLVISAVTISFRYIERFISFSYFQKALATQAVPDAENFIGKALSLYLNDLYLRTYSQIYLVKLNSIVAKGETTLSDADKADLRMSFDQAVKGAQMAVTYNPKNYLNYQLLGYVYQTVGNLGERDAYSKAIEAFTMASALNMNNPGIKLAMANVFVADQKNKEAKDYANAALALKPDYVSALLTLSQIAKNEGDNLSAFSYAQKALAISPTNADLIKYAESLKNGTNVPAPIPATDLNPKKP